MTKRGRLREMHCAPLQSATEIFISTTHPMDNPPVATRKCSQSKCSRCLPENGKYKTCERCCEHNQLHTKRKRERGKDEETHTKKPRGDSAIDPIQISGDSDRDEDADTVVPQEFLDAETLWKRLRNLVRQHGNIHFDGYYYLPTDPLISAKQHIQMTVQELWRVTAYRWTYILSFFSLKIFLLMWL